MRQTKAEIYLHFVWATHQRQLLINPEIERDVYRCIESEARRLQCVTLAIGGMADHIHLFVRIPTKVSAAMLMQQVKGVSSAFVRDQLKTDSYFGWQDGYGVFSVSRPHVEKVIAYIENQERHHPKGTFWSEWEETDQEAIKPASPVREDG